MSEAETAVTVLLDADKIERLDRWRREVEPADDRAEAAASLIFIGLDEVEGKNSHAGAEVIDTISLGISAALKLSQDARGQGLTDVADAAHRIHGMFQEIGVYLGVDGADLGSSVFERLDALRDAPDHKQ